jgi:hypothetical protein
MKLLMIKKPTKLNKKWTAKIEHQGKVTLMEFDNWTAAIRFYIRAKHEAGERFIN